MIEHIALALIGIVAVSQLVHSYRSNSCMELHETQEREIARRAAEGFKIGHAAAWRALRDELDQQDGSRNVSS